MVESSEVAFATASRDKTVRLIHYLQNSCLRIHHLQIKVWKPTDESLSNWTAVVSLKFKEAVTAIDFSPVLCDGRQVLLIRL